MSSDFDSVHAYDCKFWVFGTPSGDVLDITIPCNATLVVIKTTIRRSQLLPALFKVTSNKDLSIWAVSPAHSNMEQILNVCCPSDLTDCVEIEQTTRLDAVVPYPSVEQEIHLLVVVNTPMSDLARAAGRLQKRLWNKPLDIFLSVNIDGQSFKYIPTDQLDELNMRSLKWHESTYLVRPEYKLAYDAMKTMRESGNGGVAIIGQPGIRKTSFLYYALFQRLSEGLPTAIQLHTQAMVVFTERGGHLEPVDKGLGLEKNMWALADSGDTIERPCDAFLNPTIAELFVIQVTSPKQSRWKAWIKQREGRLYWMEPNSEAELKAFGTVLRADIDVLLNASAKWGCSVRVCLQVAQIRSGEEELKNAAIKAAKEFVQDVKNFLRLGECPSTMSIPHSIICERPVSNTDRSAQWTEISTKHIQDIIAKEVAEADAAQQSMFFAQISSHPWLKSSSGYLFEKFLFIRLTAASQSQPLICESVISNPSQPSTLIIPTCTSVIPLDDISGLAEAAVHPLPFCWRPTSQNFPLVDAIICTKGEVILLQCTVSSQHSLDAGTLDRILGNFPKEFLSARQRCLVYVTDRPSGHFQTPPFEQIANKCQLNFFMCLPYPQASFPEQFSA